MKLPFQFDKNRLLADLQSIVGEQWNAHYNHSAYEGDWKVLALYSTTGNEEDIFAAQSSDLELKETQLMKRSSYLRDVVNEFKCPLLSVRLLKLSAGAIIKPHRDFKLGYENGDFRIHIPIITNDKVKFILGGERIIMLPGECWYTNVNYVHSVSNEGESDRVHLVIDCQRNNWSDTVFFTLALKKDLIPIEASNQIELYRRMVAELEQLNEPASAELITTYKKKIGELNSN